MTGQEQENRLPLYPHSLQINFKYSFTVKYIRLLRQVFSPFQSLHCEFKNILYRAYVNSLSPVRDERVPQLHPLLPFPNLTELSYRIQLPSLSVT
jgi:hypothetical protein